MPRARQHQSWGWLEVSNTQGSQGAMCQEPVALGERARRHLSPPSTCRPDRPAARLSASPKGPQSKRRITPSAGGAKAGGIIQGREKELGISPGGGLGEGVALSDVKTWLPEVGRRSTNSFHTAPQTDTLPFLRSTDAYIYLKHRSSQGLY